MVMDFDLCLYVSEVSCVWIFGFMCDLEYMNVNNLVLGGSMENVVVLDEFCVFNFEGLCYDDEFLKYKILDVIGDLYFGGYSLIGELCVYKIGYGLNNKLLNVVFV